MSHSVSFSELQGLIDDMARFDAHVEAQLKDLDGQMSRLHAVWVGEAADQQRAAHRELVRGIEDMRTALTHLRAAGRIAHGNYSAAVAANSRMMGQVG